MEQKTRDKDVNETSRLQPKLPTLTANVSLNVKQQQTTQQLLPKTTSDHSVACTNERQKTFVTVFRDTDSNNKNHHRFFFDEKQQTGISKSILPDCWQNKMQTQTTSATASSCCNIDDKAHPEDKPVPKEDAEVVSSEQQQIVSQTKAANMIHDTTKRKRKTRRGQNTKGRTDIIINPNQNAITDDTNGDRFATARLNERSQFSRYQTTKSAQLSQQQCERDEYYHMRPKQPKHQQQSAKNSIASSHVDNTSVPQSPVDWSSPSHLLIRLDDDENAPNSDRHDDRKSLPMNKVDNSKVFKSSAKLLNGNYDQLVSLRSPDERDNDEQTRIRDKQQQQQQQQNRKYHQKQKLKRTLDVNHLHHNNYHSNDNKISIGFSSINKQQQSSGNSCENIHSHNYTDYKLRQTLSADHQHHVCRGSVDIHKIAPDSTTTKNDCSRTHSFNNCQATKHQSKNKINNNKQEGERRKSTSSSGQQQHEDEYDHGQFALDTNSDPQLTTATGPTKHLTSQQTISRSLSIPIKSSATGRVRLNSSSSLVQSYSNNNNSPSSLLSNHHHHPPLSSSISSTSSSSGFASSISHNNNASSSIYDANYELANSTNSNNKDHQHDSCSSVTISIDQLSFKSSTSLFDSLSIRSEEDSSYQDTVSLLDIDSQTISTNATDEDWPTIIPNANSSHNNSCSLVSNSNNNNNLKIVANNNNDNITNNVEYDKQQQQCCDFANNVDEITSANISDCISDNNNKIFVNNSDLLLQNQQLTNGISNYSVDGNVVTRALGNDRNFNNRQRQCCISLEGQKDCCETNQLSQCISQTTAQQLQQQKSKIKPLMRTVSVPISTNDPINGDTNRDNQQPKIIHQTELASNPDTDTSNHRRDKPRKHKRMRNNPTKRERLHLKQLKLLKQQLEQATACYSSPPMLDCCCTHCCFDELENRAINSTSIKNQRQSPEDRNCLNNNNNNNNIDSFDCSKQNCEQNSNPSQSLTHVEKEDSYMLILPDSADTLNVANDNENKLKSFEDLDQSQLTRKSFNDVEPNHYNPRASLATIIKHGSLGDSFNDLSLIERTATAGRPVGLLSSVDCCKQLSDETSKIQLPRVIMEPSSRNKLYADTSQQPREQQQTTRKSCDLTTTIMDYNDSCLANINDSVFFEHQYIHHQNQHMTCCYHTNLHRRQQQQQHHQQQNLHKLKCLNSFNVNVASNVVHRHKSLPANSCLNLTLDNNITRTHSRHNSQLQQNSHQLNYSYNMGMSSSPRMGVSSGVSKSFAEQSRRDPPPRPWLKSNEQNNMTKPSDTNHKNNPPFSVMCYNILSDIYATKQKYSYCPDYALNWTYRKQKIFNEIKSSGSDLISLQEVETNQFYDYFLPQLRLEGYEGIFAPKSRAKTMLEPFRRLVDGCAIFYKASKFKLVEQNLIEFNKIAMANAHGSDAMLNRVMTKDNIGIAALLELIDQNETDPPQDMEHHHHDKDKDPVLTLRLLTDRSNSLPPPSNDSMEWPPLINKFGPIEASSDSLNYKKLSHNSVEHLNGCVKDDETKISKDDHKNLSTCKEKKRLLVCTAHIHWDPEFCDVKLIQTIMLMNELTSMAKKACEDGKRDCDGDIINIPLVLCGDFNSLPDSGVFKFLTDGRISVDHADFKNYAYRNCFSMKTKTINSGAMSKRLSDNDEQQQYYHSFNLDTAYNTNIMPYTNYTSSFCGMIDYIFYSKSLLNVKGVLGPLDDHWIKENGVVGLPQPNFPSDHFPILAELELNPSVGLSKQPLLLSNILKSESYNTDNITAVVDGTIERRKSKRNEKKNLVTSKSDKLTKNSRTKNK